MDFIRESRRSRELNLTPLVDIVLMLVIFFMLSTSFVVSESMELTLPSGKPSGKASAAGVLRIQLIPTGEVQVDNVIITRENLNTVLVDRLAQDPDKKIAIFTTPGVSVQQLVSVLDDVYLTGGRNVQVDKVGD